jgi:predicted MFS family arabinose efflux permease
VGFLGVFGALGFGRFGYSAVLPSMKDGLHISSAAAGSLASWNLGGYVVMALVSGVLTSRFGARRIVAIGSVVAAAGMLVTGLAPMNHAMLQASAGRLLTGLGGGMCLVPSVALMSAWFDVRTRGLASSIVTSGPSLALVITGPAVPRLISSIGPNGWRWAWFFFAAMCCLVAVLTAVFQRDRPYPEYLALKKAKQEGVSVRQRANLRSVVRSRYAWHLGAVYMMFGFAYISYFTFFQTRLIKDLGWSADKAGALFLVLGVASLFCGVIWGTISDRTGRGRALASMCVIQAIASVLFAVWPSTSGIVLSAVIFGLCSLAVPGIVGAGCGDQFGPVLASASLGFVTVFFGVGQAAGPYLLGGMADIFGSYANSYLVAAGVFLVGTVLALFLREGKWRAESAEAETRVIPAEPKAAKPRIE